MHKEALGQLATLKRFFLYALQPDPSKPGKTKKVPTTPQGVPHGADDPKWLVGFDEALAASRAATFPCTVGVSISAPYFFVDVDGCADEAGQLNAVGQSVLSAFPGAFIEFSTSRRGIHIIGRAEGVLPHRSRRDDIHVEFYTEGRGCALNLAAQWGGSADSDHTHQINSAWIPQHFPPRTASELGAEPRPEWRGPVDDETLIARMMRSQPAANALGADRIRFADLWLANEAALSEAFPRADGPGFDRSRADMALAQHLAFWTGCDAVRMQRLMMASALVRDKWLSRPDYLVERTIGNAVSMQGRVLQDKPVLPVPPPPGGEAIAQPVAHQTFLGGPEQIEYFKGCVYVVDKAKVWTPNYVDLLDVGQFNAVYGGRSFSLTAANDKVTDKAFDVITRGQLMTFPKAETTVYRPDQPSGVIIGNGVNVYRNDGIVATHGADVSPFLDHMSRLFPDDGDRAIILAYMAAVVQHPGVKFGWCPVIQGCEGNGKTTLAEILHKCVGPSNHSAIGVKELGSQFTGWLVNKVFIVANDIYVDSAKTELLEGLKPIISDRYQRTEVKGGAQATAEITANFMVTCNRKDAVKVTDDSRRWAPFFTPQQRAEDLAVWQMDGRYFPVLREWLDAGGWAAVAGWLKDYAIPDELNPARDARRAPVTTSTAEAIGESLGTVEMLIMEAIEQQVDGFCGGWVNQQIAMKYLKEHGQQRLTIRGLHRILDGLKFIPHPLIGYRGDGWTDNPIGIESTKSRLWIKRGHLTTLNNQAAPDLINLYRHAQRPKAA